MNPPNCKKCHVPMVKGTAIQQTYTGTPEGTRYLGGPGKQIECWKCPKCGHSITMNSDTPLTDTNAKFLMELEASNHPLPK